MCCRFIGDHCGASPIDQPTVSDFILAFSQAAQCDDDACHKTGQLVSGLIDRFRVNFVNELWLTKHCRSFF
ncbi:hypothetical protein [Idiomarina abyssalis]|uniref:hypothetical protein n=1 Tax=Idiomarina abyssalis TaxID=86102 RepID=UPI001CD1C91C|nr:hypothetical protein [Idiomarina abyssalis]